MAYHVRNNTDRHRFEIESEGSVAYTVYVQSEKSIEFQHTVVPPELEGKGIGSALAKHVLEYAKKNHLETIVRCPFIRSWQEKHPA